MDNNEQLKLLSIFHYVVAAIAGMFSLFPLIHLIIGIVFVVGGEGASKATPQMSMMGWFLIIFASCFICIGQAFAWSLFFAGRNLAKRKKYTFCLVMAGVACIFVPFGTVLGVFTIITLIKDPVKEQFTS